MAWGPGHFGRSRLLVPQLYDIGTRSIMVVLLLGVFVGAAIGVEAYGQFQKFGIASHAGALVALTVVAQIGPVLAATMVAGRAGGRISSELGTMRITDQLDAMRLMGVDPVAQLVVPRVLACVLMMPVLTVFSDMVGVGGGYLVVVCGYHIDAVTYTRAMAEAVTSWDVFTGLFKGAVFGCLVGMISCYKGIYCGQGAQGVGRAATSSFFTAFVWIIVSDLLLVNVFHTLYPLIYGHAHPTVFG